MIISGKKIDALMKYSFSVDDSDFFSSTFSSRNVVKDLLSLEYTLLKDKREKYCYEGIAYCNNEIRNNILKDSIFIDLNLRKYKLSKNDVLIYYREKIRKNHWLCITYNDELIIGETKYVLLGIDRENKINTDGCMEIKLTLQKNDNEVVTIDAGNFQISVPPYIYDFIEEVLNLKKYEYEHLFFNPVHRSSFHEREDYFKLLLIFFCNNGGLNTKQIFHIIDIARAFGFSSKLTEYIIKNILNLNKAEKKRVWSQLFSRINNKDILMIDITYMIAIGNYPKLVKFEMMKKYSDENNTSVGKMLYVFEYVTRKELQGDRCIK